MTGGGIAITQEQLDDRFKSFDKKITEQISKEVTKAISKAITKEVIGASSQRQTKWDLVSVIGSIVAATALIFMFINTKIEAVNTKIDIKIEAVNTKIEAMNIKIEALSSRIDSLEKDFSELKAEVRVSNQRILDKLDRLEQNRSN